jgi:hypothetical protein
MHGSADELSEPNGSRHVASFPRNPATLCAPVYHERVDGD